MGIVTSVLAEVNFTDNAIKKLTFEMNKSNKIHIQSDYFRIEMKVEEFIQFASHVIIGANKLIGMKDL